MVKLEIEAAEIAALVASGRLAPGDRTDPAAVAAAVRMTVCAVPTRDLGALLAAALRRRAQGAAGREARPARHSGFEIGEPVESGACPAWTDLAGGA